MWFLWSDPRKLLIETTIVYWPTFVFAVVLLVVGIVRRRSVVTEPNVDSCCDTGLSRYWALPVYCWAIQSNWAWRATFDDAWHFTQGPQGPTDMLKDMAFLIVFALFIVALFVAAVTSLSTSGRERGIPNYGIAVVTSLVLVDVILTMFVLM